MSQRHQTDDIHLDEVIFEFQRFGTSIRCNAMHPETLIEITVVGPKDQGLEILKHVAMRKLKYVLRKKLGISEGDTGVSGDTDTTANPYATRGKRYDLIG